MSSPATAPDPDYKGSSFMPKGAGNRGQYDNAEVNRLRAEGRATYDTAKRENIYRRVQRMLYEDAYFGSVYVVLDNDWC